MGRIVTIRNAQTGETKQVPEEQLGQYGVNPSPTPATPSASMSNVYTPPQAPAPAQPEDKRTLLQKGSDVARGVGLGFIPNTLAGIYDMGTGVDNFKKNVAAGNLSKIYDPEFRKSQADKLRKRTDYSNPFRTQEETAKAVQDNPLASAAKDTAGAASWALPVGKGATALSSTAKFIGSEGLRGAAAGYATSKNGDELKDSAVGAVTGPILGGATKLAGKALSGTGALVKGAGKSMEKGMINPQVPASANAYAKEQELVDGLKSLGISGPPEQMRKQSSELYQKLGSEIKSDLANSSAGIGLQRAKAAVTKTLEENGTYYVPGDASYEQLLGRELSKLEKKSVNGKLSAEALFDFKNELGGLLGNAFKKENGELSSAITTPEGVRLDLWHQIDHLITGMEPGVKDKTLQQSLLHSAASGLKKSAAKESSLELLGTKIPVNKEIAQGVQNKMAGVMQGAGGKTNTAGNVIQKGTKAATNVGGFLSGILSGDAPDNSQDNTNNNQGKDDMYHSDIVTQGQPIVNTPEPKMITIRNAQTGETKQIPAEQASQYGINGAQAGIPDKDTLDREYFKALQMGGTQGSKAASSIMAALNHYYPEATKKVSQQEFDRKQLGYGVATALGMLNGDEKPKIGILGNQSITENIKAKFNKGDPSTVKFNQVLAELTASIAKSRGGTSFTPSEREMLEQYAPHVGDSDQEVKSKLLNLAQKIDYMQNVQIDNAPIGQNPQSADMSAAYAQ